MKLRSIYKLIYSFGLIMLALGFFSACTEDDTVKNPFVNFDYVFWGSNDLSVTEGNALVTSASGQIFAAKSGVNATLSRFSRDVSDVLTVTVNFTAVYQIDSDFFSAGEDASDRVVFSGVENLTANSFQITFQPGEYNKLFRVFSVDDDFAAGNVVVELTIASTSIPKYAVGKPEVTLDTRDVKTIIIEDDDCPIDLSEWEGEYAFAAIIGASYNASFAGDNLCTDFGICPSGAPLTLVANEDDPLGLQAILSGPDLATRPMTIEFVTCTEQVRILTSGHGILGRAAWGAQQGAALGTFDSERKTLNLNFVLGTNGDFVMTLVKIN
ncbi:MAG: hypothetical protein JJU28_11780 [Cyclobacteriaceae bacterium]|nr:hypothetical protein [Cyclobacteriaceae bacterium]